MEMRSTTTSLSSNRGTRRHQTRTHKSASPGLIPPDVDREAEGDARNDSGSGSDSDNESDSDYDDDGDNSGGSEEDDNNDTRDDSGRLGAEHEAERSPFLTGFDDNIRHDELHDIDAPESHHRPRKRRKRTDDPADESSIYRTNSGFRRPARSHSRTIHSQASAMPSPSVSHSMSEQEGGSDQDCMTAPRASFSEWQLRNAALKCGTINGVNTYQLQFQRAQAHSSIDRRQDRQPRRPASARRARFTTEEDRLLTQLRSCAGLTWNDIHEQFDAKFPGRRSLGTLQVHYSTKLRKRGLL